MAQPIGESDKALVATSTFSHAFGLRAASVQSTLASKRPAHWLWRRRGLELNTLSTAHVLDCGDGIRLSGRHTKQTQRTSRGLVILIHGWQGCHDSSYLYSMASMLFQAGYNIFRLNLRDHGFTYGLNEEIFHSARFAEVLGAVRAIRKLDDSQAFFTIGFSLGGNFALRLAMLGPAQGLLPKLTIAISPVMNPAANLRAIDTGPLIFRRYFLGRWRLSLDNKRKAWPNYDFSVFNGLSSFVEITKQFVRHYTEYGSYAEYLAQYTLSPAMLMDAESAVALITARDDSVIPIGDFSGLEARGSVISCDISERGGHCGFIENWRLDSWAERRVAALLALHD